jgi:cell wall-associated NlpC family hydrolase
MAADRTLSEVRFAAVFSSVAAALVLGACGADAEHAATQPTTVTAPAAESTVFTVPDELPPSERTRPASDGSEEREPASPSEPAAGAPSDDEVQRELAEALGVDPGDDVVDQAGLTADGYATVPPGAPPEVEQIINAANKVAHAPYRYGGGHGGVGGDETWVDTAYDCSGSISFALASAGLVESQLTSGSFMSWGKPGPGKWVTIVTNEGHAYMIVAGLRFDTVERARTGTRWGPVATPGSDFVLRHPVGL